MDSSILRLLSGTWNDPKGDVLIVLGSDTVEGMIGESSYWRSVYATWTWRQGRIRKMIISGGARDGTAPVAKPMKDFLVCQGVPESVVQIETESASTRENAINTTRLLKDMPGRKILLTSDYHAFRVYHAFRKSGLEVVPSPFPDHAKRISGRSLSSSRSRSLRSDTMRYAAGSEVNQTAYCNLPVASLLLAGTPIQIEGGFHPGLQRLLDPLCNEMIGMISQPNR